MRKKTEKQNLLLSAALLGFLLICLSGCVTRTGPEEQELPAASGAPETTPVILLQGGSAECRAEGVSVSGSEIVIGAPGEYELRGTLENGRVLIRTGRKTGDVTLILNDAHLSCEGGPAIEELEAGNLILRLAEGTENAVHSGGAEARTPDPDAVGAAILAEDALILEGSGSLRVEGFLNNGIAGKKELSILGGALQIHATNCGISVAKYIEILDGSIDITAGNDGVRTHSDKVAGKGDISIGGGNLKITAAGDGIAAEGTLTVSGGLLEITTEGDPEIVSCKGMKAQKDAAVTGGELTVTSRDNALHTKGELLLSGGELTLRSEFGKGVMAGGSIRLDGDAELDVTAAGNGIETDTDLLILGGNARIRAGGDGLRAGDSGTGKGAFRMEGGFVRVSAANDALDAKISLRIDGGNLFAAGNSYRIQRISEESRQKVMSIALEEAETGSIEVRTESGSVLGELFADVPATLLYFSSPELKEDEQYVLHLENGVGLEPVGSP
ncbi:MAG: carbohydrate-binding domain-containing protein [Oscillospiraceae bacterium]|nr:carbohydrate-binding domain-containing protein [Oscillospiraceae bacterium]